MSAGVPSYLHVSSENVYVLLGPLYNQTAWIYEILREEFDLKAP